MVVVKHPVGQTGDGFGQSWAWKKMGLSSGQCKGSDWKPIYLMLRGSEDGINVETCRDCGLDHQTSNVSFDKGAQQHRVAWSNTEQLCLSF